MKSIASTLFIFCILIFNIQVNAQNLVELRGDWPINSIEADQLLRTTSSDCLYQLDSISTVDYSSIAGERPGSHSIYDYDDEGKLRIHTVENFEQAVILRDSFLYNEASFCDTVRRDVWYTDSLDFWSPSILFVYQYNSNGDRTFSGRDKWSDTLQVFRPSSRWNYYYDDNNVRTAEELDYWSQNSGWYSGIRIEHEYDADGFRTHSNWYGEKDGEDWVLTRRNDYVYNEDGNLISDTRYTIGPFVGVRPYSANYYEYNAEGVNTVDTRAGYNSVTEEFEPYAKYEYQHFWLPAENLLLPWNLSNLPHWRAQILDAEEYAFRNNEWVLDEKFDYFYSSCNMGVAVAEIQEVEVKLLPNPVVDFARFEFPSNYRQARLLVINMSGQLMFEREIQSGESITVNDLLPGNYLYQLQFNDESIALGKFLIEVP